MLRLGEMQELKIARMVNFGVYLEEIEYEGNYPDEVLLPRKQVPEGASVGDIINVFIYKDSEDRVIATVDKPLITLGSLAVLKVVSTGKIGAFLDWGLPKDLLLPFKEQTGKVEKGDSCLVSLYIDRSKRLCATMKVYDKLKNESPYKTGDNVEGIVYDRNDRMGVFVAVDNIYSARIPEREDFRNIKVGDRIKARVTRVLDDGRLDLSVNEKSYLQMDTDAEFIFKEITERGGKLPYTDKADPELIRDDLHMSKAAFKRAVGRLLKNGRILITEDGIIAK